MRLNSLKQTQTSTVGLDIRCGSAKLWVVSAFDLTRLLSSRMKKVNVTVSIDPWKVLELEPTSDQQLIEAAYQKKLAELASESEQVRDEQTTLLKQAYDDALQTLKQPFSPSEASQAHPLYQEFNEELTQLLGNALRRNQLTAWQLLIDHPAGQEHALRDDLSALIFDQILHYQKTCEDDKQLISSEILIYLTEQLEWSKRDDLQARYGDNFYYRMTQQRLPEPELIPEPIADTGNLANIFIGLTIVCAIGLLMISV
ncbi:hypothetical protein A7985_14020 [Pseudoalteromonas luteoviolacea]|uniref:Uncharacterized protein n=1 Tax=Pseudoalteromonas luteoviolacea TaxID=43657 RepID=A0A1C0TPN9_9GAMM|nr:hypothetical protein [Pseudoalteromonas luteoviolacea]MBQ4811870.1 hypothetical protein [Pseudoalteromonas luteoviolacea]OCQ20907.1 hypothetical protein A7985_14020 [Pseudoalteromonas luteoviolacea]